MAENYTGQFNIEELLQQMMREILQLKAENKLQKSMIMSLFRQASEESAQSLRKSYFPMLEELYREILVDHLWTKGYWRDKIASELGLTEHTDDGD